jgi:hypothetical protein
MEAVLESLRVKSGLIGSGRKSLGGPWAISFQFDRQNNSFTLTLYYGARSTTMGLTREDVETRGRSQWMTDNTWRLSPRGVQKAAESIRGAIERTEAKAPAS